MKNIIKYLSVATLMLLVAVPAMAFNAEEGLVKFANEMGFVNFVTEDGWKNLVMIGIGCFCYTWLSRRDLSHCCFCP